LQRLVRRFSSQVVKADAPAESQKVVESGRRIYQLQDYQTKNLKEYFDQNALAMPVETI